jgi:hypothetical protein
LQEGSGGLLEDVEHGVEDGGAAALPKEAEGDGVEAFEREGFDFGMEFEAGDVDGDANAVAVGDVGLDHFDAADFDAAEPVDVAFGESVLEGAADGFVAGDGDEGLFDAVLLPEFFGGGEAAGFGEEEDEGHFEQGYGVDTNGGFAAEQADGEVDFLLEQPGEDLGVVAFAEGDFEFGELLAELLEHFGEEVAQDGFGRGDAEVLGDAAAEFFGHGSELVKKGFDEGVEFLARWGEREGSAVKEGNTEEFFELNDLAADGGLLDAVGHVADGFTDAAVFGNVVEEFEVVNVHRLVRRRAPVWRPRGGREFSSRAAVAGKETFDRAGDAP